MPPLCRDHRPNNPREPEKAERPVREEGYPHVARVPKADVCRSASHGGHASLAILGTMGLKAGQNILGLTIDRAKPCRLG